jgi:hypothetical protein
VQHHLDNEPVMARPPNAGYRLRKLVLRHRAASGTLALVTLAVLLGVLVSTWALVRERAARAQADQRLRAALAFVDQVFNRVAPEFAKVAGATKGQERLGQAGLEFVKDLRASAGDVPEVRVALARLLIYLSEAQGSPGEANTVGDYEAGLQRAEEAVELLSADSPHLSSAERLHLLVRAKFSTAVCLWGLGRWDEELVRLREIDPLLVRLERFPEFAQWARSHLMGNVGSVGLVTAAAGRPQEAIERHLLPLLKSDWARSVTTNSSEFELETLANAYGSLAMAHEFLDEFDAMIPAAGEALRISDVLGRRFPQNARHHAFTAGLRAQQGYGMLRAGRTAEGLAALNTSRVTIEALVSKDAASDHFRIWHIMIVATQARAFAAWSNETSSPLVERQRRLAEAETYLVTAETLFQASKSKAPELALRPARAEVAAAKAKLGNGIPSEKP